MCFPGFDSPTIFRSAIGITGKAGSFQAGPGDAGREFKNISTSRFEGAVDLFMSEQGCPRSSDFMPILELGHRAQPGARPKTILRRHSYEMSL